MVDIKAMDAATAYANAAKNLTQNGTAGGVSAGGEGKDAFTNVLGDMLEQVSGATSTSENTALKTMQGQADVLDVVTAVNNAEMVVDTVVAVRDKVISAYNEIIKMPI